jgi:hypothetical protein
MSGSKNFSNHNAERGKSYQEDMERKLREREDDDKLYDTRKIKDFDTDPRMNGYGILNNAGLTGRELEFDEDVDDKTVRKLLEYRKKTKKTN